jgi:uncharacterized membrane protein YeaQ/YmgE (transglycosylase-associated protein family)
VVEIAAQVRHVGRWSTKPGEIKEREGKAHMNLIAWIVLGAIAGYLAGFLVKGDEGLGVIGHVVLGIVGALIGGFLAGVLLNVKDPIQGALDLSTIVVSVIGAVVVVVVAGMLTGNRRVGRGPV